jgi:hypothetical protein
LKNELQKDQLFTKKGAIKMAGINTATLSKAINNGIVKPYRNGLVKIGYFQPVGVKSQYIY